MKLLYLNNKRLVISDDIYFPFNQKVSDLEDISIIGLMASKSVSIPRCQINDEIFGYVGQINRVVINDQDNKIGISFNQTKKAKYILYNNSSKISEGIIKITNITEKEYTIELYDKLIELLTDFEGDDTTGEGYLSELDLKLSGNTTFSMISKGFNVYTYLKDATSEVKPCFNIKKYDSTGTNAMVSYVPSSGVTYPRVITLQEEMTPIQFRSLKNWELDYAVPLSTVFRSINAKYENIIDVDTKLTTLFNDVHFNMGQPKNIYSYSSDIISGGTLGKVGNYIPNQKSWGPIAPNTSIKSELVANNLSSVNLCQENGKYVFNIPFEMLIEYDGIDDSTSSSYLSVYNGTQYYPNAEYGTKFGELFLDVYLQSFDPNDHNWQYFRSSKTRALIPLYVGVNTTLNINEAGKIYSINVFDTMNVTIDYYPKFNQWTNKNYLMFDFTPMWQNTIIFRRKGWVYHYPTVSTTISNIELNYSSLDFRTGDVLNGQTLFPKLSIKDFIIGVAKYFNLGLMNNNGRIRIHKKEYTLSYDAPLLEINDMTVSNFDFGILKMSSEMTSDKLFTDYKKNTKKQYGQQIINTGYNIRKTTKEVKFDAYIPPLIKDTNYYAYTDFCGYNNNGRSRPRYGVTEGTEDKLQFGYILRQVEPISVGDDNYYEANMSDNGYYVPTETKWMMVNEQINYYQSGGTFEYPTEYSTGQNRLLNVFNTFSPYKIDINGNVTASLELAKPDFNYGNVLDAQYSSGITHYKTYFSDLVHDIYSVDAHILNVKMWINKKIDIYSIINYRNSLYRIQDIPEYDPTRIGFYNVKLLRVNDINNYGVVLPTTTTTTLAPTTTTTTTSGLINNIISLYTSENPSDTDIYIKSQFNTTSSMSINYSLTYGGNTYNRNYSGYLTTAGEFLDGILSFGVVINIIDYTPHFDNTYMYSVNGTITTTTTTLAPTTTTTTLIPTTTTTTTTSAPTTTTTTTDDGLIDNVIHIYTVKNEGSIDLMIRSDYDATSNISIDYTILLGENSYIYNYTGMPTTAPVLFNSITAVAIDIEISSYYTLNDLTYNYTIVVD